jgi:DNA-binding LacI/PurR family transcriptional regulator
MQSTFSKAGDLLWLVTKGGYIFMSDATIKDVAKAAGVSTATVSRVINGNYNVSSEIEQKVLKAIDELKYFPNSVARSLKNDSTYTIGFLVSDISNSYFTTIAKVVEDIVSPKNYNIIMCSTEEEKSRELNYLKLLVSKKVDGLILNTTGKNDDFIAALSKKIPIVLINRRLFNMNYNGDFIDGGNLDGVYDLTAHLIAYGHRKIGVINGDLSVSTGMERFEGFKMSMKEIGINVDLNYPYRFDGQFTMESGYQGAAYLMGLSEPPSGIVVMNNSMTLGALKYFRMNGIRVPEEISIVSFGNIENVELMYVKPSIVTLNAYAIGNKVGKVILERIHNPTVKNREVIITPQLIVGDSVRRI